MTQPQIVRVKPPDLPAWVQDSPACVWAWQNDVDWQMEAKYAETAKYQQSLRTHAEKNYAASSPSRKSGRKGGPPFKSEADKHSRRLMFWVTQAEMDAILARVPPNRSFASWAREQLLGPDPHDSIS